MEISYKQKIREEMKARRAALSETERAAASLSALDRLVASGGLWAPRENVALDKRIASGALWAPHESVALGKFVAFEELSAPGREICVYSSFGSELSTEGLKTYLFEHDYRVSVPVTVSESEMVAARVTADTDYVTGAFGIRVPKTIDEADKRLLDVVVVPGLAFDKAGRRVGFGKGYYDRFLAETGALRVGLCFDFQLVGEVPGEPHDLPMDLVVTDGRIFWPKT